MFRSNYVKGAGHKEIKEGVSMPSYRGLLAFLLCCSVLIPSIAIAEEWVEVTRSESGNVLFVDKLSIELTYISEVTFVKARVKTVYSSSPTDLIDIFRRLANLMDGSQDVIEFASGDETWKMHRNRLSDIRSCITLEYFDCKKRRFITLEEVHCDKEGREVVRIKYKLPSRLVEESFSYIKSGSVYEAILDYLIEYFKKTRRIDLKSY